MNKTLLVSGFHRSATSATANLLANAGLNMGIKLMGNHISNPKGHFEDLFAVQLHDKQLAKSHTSWQFHDEVALDCQSDFLADYIAQRSQSNQYWGVKDPRACLFLEQWHDNLGDQGYYLFVIRHWSSCIESLLHRQSRMLAHELPGITSDQSGLRFWLQSDLPAKMWLAYNKRLLAFAKSHPERTIVASQRALFADAPIITHINQNFGFNLNENAPSPFENELLRDQASQSVEQILSTSLKIELEAVWQQLLGCASYKTENERPVYYQAEPLSAAFIAGYTEQLRPGIINSHALEPEKESSIDFTV